MCNDEVRLNIEAGRVQHPELEQRIRSPRLRRDLKPIHPHVHPCHHPTPVVFLIRLRRDAA
jgi:hypothetical protein